MPPVEIDLNNPTVSTTKPQPQVVQRGYDATHTDLSSLTRDITTADQLLDKLSNSDTIPWEETTLPSKGEYYDGMVPGGVVRIRPMGMQAEKVMYTQRLVQSGQAADHLLNTCVQFPDGFDQNQLLVGDQLYLLFYLRGITYGNVYEFMMKCPNCKIATSHVFDLNLMAETITYTDPAIGPEPFKIVLPYLSKSLGKTLWVMVRFMRRGDIASVANRQRFQRRATVSTPRIHGRQAPSMAEAGSGPDDDLVTLITSFGGDGLAGEVVDRSKIHNLVNTMHSIDLDAIRSFLDRHNPGIETKIDITCSDCGSDFITTIPITESFFRAAKPRGVRE